MKKFATILIAATFSAPALATGVVDFGLGIDEGYKFGHEFDRYTSQHVGGGMNQTSNRHIIDVGGGTDQAYTYDRGDDHLDVMISDEPAKSEGRLIDFGLGIDEGYEYCRC